MYCTGNNEGDGGWVKLLVSPRQLALILLLCNKVSEVVSTNGAGMLEALMCQGMAGMISQASHFGSDGTTISRIVRNRNLLFLVPSRYEPC